MKIQYFGHSCFRIISEMNTAIICDPYKAEMLGFAMPKVSCDVVTISHHHRDHDCVEEVKGSPAVLEGDVRLAADDIAIQTIQSFHDDKKGKLRGKNTIFCFSVDGLKVVHMGDIGVFDNDLAKSIYKCDVLMIPVGGVYTVDAAQANKYVQAVCPKICIPMHYKTENSLLDIDPIDNFLALQNNKNVRMLDSETFVVNDLPENEETLIVVPKPFVEEI